MVPMSDLPLLRWPLLDAADGILAGVTTRHGGVSTAPYDSLNLGLHVGDDPAAVVENRRRVAMAFGAGLDDLVVGEQTHQPTVAVVTTADRGRGVRTRDDALPATDAMITASPGVLLMVMVADCVPLVLFDPVRRLLGVVHAGWAGTVRGVTTAAVSALIGQGSDPADLLVGIGPAISPEKYQVGADVHDAVVAAFGDDADRVLRPDGTGRHLFDLFAANRLQLERAGVRPDRIQLSGAVTGPDTDFFSHRAGAPTGRFAALARLT